MAAPDKTQLFVDVSGVSYNGVNIYGVKNITVTRQNDVVYGEDNNTYYNVASHVVRKSVGVTITTEDGYALLSLQAVTGAHNLAFSWVKSETQLGSNALSTKAVVISNLVLEQDTINMNSKAPGAGSISGRCLGAAGDVDPVAIT